MLIIKESFLNNTLLLVVILFFLIAIILIVLEIKKMLKNKKPSLSFGNGQYIGQAEHQNDYFSALEINEFETLLFIADGTSRRGNIRQSCIMASNVVKNTYLENRQQHSFKDIIKYAFREIEDKNKQYYFENRIAISMLSVQIKNDFLYYGNIGTCSLLIYRNGEIIQISVDNDMEEKYGHVRLLPKDKVVLLTKGAFLSISELEIIEELETKKDTNDKAISIINTIRNKRYKHQDNATVLIIEIERLFIYIVTKF